jgi:hypothetical protein
VSLKYISTLLLFGTIVGGPIWVDDQLEIAHRNKIRDRLEHMIRQTGPLDPRPTIIMEHIQFGPTAYRCIISTLDGKKSWIGTNDTAQEAMVDALNKYMVTVR